MTRLDAMDQLATAHAQSIAVLAVLQMSFNSKAGEPELETISGAVWAVQCLLDQARAAVEVLSTRAAA
jgi:hypothetical protein